MSIETERELSLFLLQYDCGNLFFRVTDDYLKKMTNSAMRMFLLEISSNRDFFALPMEDIVCSYEKKKLTLISMETEVRMCHTLTNP